MTGTWSLVRLALRRDRILLPAWILGLTVMVTSSVVATRDLYPTRESLTSAAQAINATGSLVALYGKVYDPGSLGAISLIKLTAFGAAVVAVLFVYVAVRHTRTEEETGRLELVAAGSVGRSAPLAAAMIVGCGAAILLGLLCAVGIGAAGLPWAGAFAFGLGWALTGVVFTGVGVVAAQLTTSARAALGLGMIGVGIAYALRAVGDLAAGDPGWLSWLSPIGWSQQLRPFAGDRWWVAGLPLLASALLFPLAFWLRGHRDLGAGFLPERHGPARGSLTGVWGLAWRLQRGLFVAWLVAAVLMGLVLGSIVDNVSGLLDSPQMQQYIAVLGGEQGLVQAFLAAEVGIFGVLVSAYGVAAASRLHTEESTGHLESILATATTRVRWALTHLVLALAGVAVIMVGSGAAIGLTHGLAVGDPAGQALLVAGAAAAQIPAAWVMTALVLLVFAVAPRAVPAVWGVLVVFIVLGEFGALWKLPTWLLDVSPFAHSPKLPGPAIDVVPLLVLLAVTAALCAVGLAVWRRRDVQL